MDEEYSKPGSHHERYGLTQYQMGLETRFSIPWEGSARELIRDSLEEPWRTCEPIGVAYKVFTRNKTRVTIRTFPEAKALYQRLTDELNHYRIDGRQRNSIHRVRDILVEEFEEQQSALERRAVEHYNGHLFREHGELPTASYPKDSIRLDAELSHDEFAKGRVRYHVGGSHFHSEDDEVEKVADELPLMYGYAVE